MARRRGRRGRRGGGRGRRIRRSKRGTLGSRIMGIFRKPVSHIIAPTLGIGGLLYLLFTPVSTGDSWLRRLIASFQGNYGPGNYIGQDQSGNNVFTIAAQQITQNLAGAAPFFLGSVLAAWIGKWTKT